MSNLYHPRFEATNFLCHTCIKNSKLSQVQKAIPLNSNVKKKVGQQKSNDLEY